MFVSLIYLQILSTVTQLRAKIDELEAMNEEPKAENRKFLENERDAQITFKSVRIFSLMKHLPQRYKLFIFMLDILNLIGRFLIPKAQTNNK